MNIKNGNLFACRTAIRWQADHHPQLPFIANSQQIELKLKHRLHSATQGSALIIIVIADERIDRRQEILYA